MLHDFLGDLVYLFRAALRPVFLIVLPLHFLRSLPIFPWLVLLQHHTHRSLRGTLNLLSAWIALNLFLLFLPLRKLLLLFRFALDSRQQQLGIHSFGLVISSAEVLMCEVVVIAKLVALLMETVHIELYNTTLTCLTNEVYFLCLKYCGRICAEKVSRSLMTNPLPDSAQLTTFPRSSRLITERVPPASRRYCVGRPGHSSSSTSNLKK